jgi:putative transposase
MALSIRKARKPRNVVNTGRLMGEVDPIIRTTGLDRNPSVFLSRNRLGFGIPPRRVFMPRKRRSFSSTFKSKVALDAIKGLMTVAEIAKLHQVHPSQVVLWKRQLLEGVESVFDGPTDRKDKAADQPQTAELYEQIGKLNMQLEWLKKKVAENGL